MNKFKYLVPVIKVLSYMSNWLAVLTLNLYPRDIIAKLENVYFVRKTILELVLRGMK